MKSKVLFISNSIYFDLSKNEGGVRQCTLEYFDLLNLIYDVVLFPVEYKKSLKYRILVKLGFNIYNDYNPYDYKDALESIIQKNNINLIFLNLSNTATFAILLKNLGIKNLKVILCSHGNESGDYLHESVKFSNRMFYLKRFTSSYVLGKMIKIESKIRQEHIDLVLTVSEIEVALEKWLGAKRVQLIPRVVKITEINKNTSIGHFGFMGDLSHLPNYYGIYEVCKALVEKIADLDIDIRIVGSPPFIGHSLQKEFPFVTYLGYLDSENLVNEVSSWSFFLNPVFYYSRGVSTKLAKPLSWAIPIISTSIGHRGYKWEEGNLIIAETPEAFATKIVQCFINPEFIDIETREIKKIIESMPSSEDISMELYNNIQSMQ